MKIISRKEAKALGLKRYFTGKPCRRGHVSEHRTGDAYCAVCAENRAKKYFQDHKEIHRDYQVDWRKKNPERAKKSQAKYKAKVVTSLRVLRQLGIKI